MKTVSLRQLVSIAVTSRVAIVTYIITRLIIRTGSLFVCFVQFDPQSLINCSTFHHVHLYILTLEGIRGLGGQSDLIK